ncbi:MAG: ADOP family duplicated permease [Acidobacteriota bacterium]
MCRLYEELEEDARHRSDDGRGGHLTAFRARATLDLLTTVVRAWCSPDLRGRRAPRSTPTGLRSLALSARSLRRTPLFTAITVSTLALGIGANAALFSVAYGVLLRPLGLERAEDLTVAVLHREGQPGDVSGLHPAYLEDLRGHLGSTSPIERIGAYLFESGTLLQDDQAVEISSAVNGDLDFFQALGARPRLGRLPTAEDEVQGRIAPVCLISTSLWASRFGSDPGILGRTLNIDGTPMTVLGVLPGAAPLPQAGIDLWRLQSWDLEDRRLYGRLQVLVQRSPETTTVAATDRLATATRALADSHPRFDGYTFSLTDFREALVGTVRPSILLAFAGVGLLLLIACANMANLLLARASGREREIATRRALGAQARQVFATTLGESLLLSALGGALGVLFALGVQQLLLALAPPGLPRLDAVRIDLPVLAFTTLVSLIAGLFFGVAPALHALRLDPIRSLRASSSGPGAMRLRHALLVVQLAVAVVLLSGATLMTQTLLALGSVEPGFRLGGVGGARIYLDDDAYTDDVAEATYFEQLLQELGATPGIESVGLTSGLPLDPVTIDYDLPYRLPGQDDSEEITQAFFRTVSEGYFETMGMTLLQGRTFDGSERAGGEGVAVINAHFARQAWPRGNAVGESFLLYGGSRQLRVVGVVDDVRFSGPAASIKPEFFVPFRQQTYGAKTAVARSTPTNRASAVRAAAAVREAALVVDPRQPVNSVFTLEGLSSGAVATERFLAILLATFATVALLLSGAGIYGVFSYWVHQSRWELGLRRALGASRQGIVLLVLRRSLGFGGLGLVLGLAASLVSARLLTGFLFGVAPTEPTAALVVAAVLLATALLAAVLPARRAAHVAPRTSLDGG